jgi:hypothetical protein
VKSHWTEHQGKRVFIAEYSDFGMDSAALSQEAAEIIATLQQEPPNSALAISNVAGTTASMENIKILKGVFPHTNAHVRKRCAIGVTGVRWYFIEIFNELSGAAKLESFASLSEALDWIVKE